MDGSSRTCVRQREDVLAHSRDSLPTLKEMGTRIWALSYCMLSWIQCSSTLSKPDFPTLSSSEGCLALHEDFHIHSHFTFLPKICFVWFHFFFFQEKDHQHSLNATHHADKIPFLESLGIPRSAFALCCGMLQQWGLWAESLVLFFGTYYPQTQESPQSDWALLLRIMKNLSIIKLKARIDISPYNFIVMQGDWNFLLSSKGLDMTGPIWVSEDRTVNAFRALVLALNF